MTGPSPSSSPDPGKPHDHAGPTTPAEEASRQASTEAVPLVDRAKIAEEASRQEDA